MKTYYLTTIFFIFNFSAINSVHFNYLENGLGEQFLVSMSRHVQKYPELYGETCASDVALWLTSLPNTWALKMLDSYGKIPSGILKGNLNSLGSYLECIQTDEYLPQASSSIKGKYCLARVPVLPSSRATPEQRAVERFRGIGQILQKDITRTANLSPKGIVFNFGVCIPSSCSGSVVRWILSELAAELEQWTGDLGLRMTDDLGQQMTGDLEQQRLGLINSTDVAEDLCSTGEPLELSPGDWGAISVLIVMSILLILSTAYELHWIHVVKKSRPLNPLLSAFSLWTNTSRIFSCSPTRSQLSCLHGIRVLSMFWVILCHRFTVNFLFPIDNLTDVLAWIPTFSSTPILAASVSVDSFFVLSGLLLAYVFFRQMDKDKFFNIPMFYLHRLLRLLPAMSILILLQATLFRHVGGGPLWTLNYQVLVDACVEKWWTTLLFVQTYVNPAFMCLGHSWYLAVDMQLYILSPIILYPLLKWPKLGLVNAIFWTIASIVTVLVICIINEWPGAEFPLTAETLDKVSNRNELYYYPTYSRATPWLLGFLAGYFLEKSTKTTLRMNKYLVVVGWMTSLALLGAVILGLQPLQQTTHVFSYAADTMYLVFSRVAWSVGLIWIIFACAHGYGGPVNWFLSWKVFEVLGHLGYSMYLVHLIIQWTLASMWTYIPPFDITTIVHQYLGDLLITIVFAYVLSVTFESPILVLEKLIFKKKSKRTISKEFLKNDTETGETPDALEEKYEEK